MDWSKVTAKELANMKLSQKRFADGKLIFSVLLVEEEAIAYDIRYYYLNEEGCLTPSKSGFRIPIEHWNYFSEQLHRDLPELREVVCWEKGEHKLMIRYSDEYGGGVDFRLYRESDKYTGWEKKGIRVSIKDYNDFKRRISSICLVNDINFYPDLEMTTRKSSKNDSYIHSGLIGMLEV